MPKRPWSKHQKQALSEKMRSRVTEADRERGRRQWAEQNPEKAAVRQTIMNTVMPENCGLCGNTEAVLFVTDYQSTPPKFIWRCRPCAQSWRDQRR